MSRLNVRRRIDYPPLLHRAARMGWLAAAALCSAVAGAQTPWQFTGVQRLVAVADIHGAYDAFAAILRNAGLLDESRSWSGGTDHLVIVGDVLDRGADSRQALDLIMRLQDEARAAGGSVHLVLGNHEIMNIVGDLRYVAEAEYAAFAEDETPEMRDAAFARLSRPDFDAGDATRLRAEFDRRHPPGFFAHRAAFSPTGRYGAWLLDQPFLVVVDQWAFVHGGLAAASQDLIAAELNAQLQEQLRSYAVALGVLIDEGVLSPDDNFFDHPALLSAWSERVTAGDAVWPGATQTAANIVGDLNSAFAFDVAGPTWYRGNVACSPLIETDRLSATLRAVGAEHLVVGHTPSRDATIHSRFERGLYRIDTGMLREYYGGRAAALVVEGAQVSAVYEDDPTPSPVAPQAREVGRRPAGMTAEQLEQFLSSAPIVMQQESVDGRWSLVSLREGDLEMAAAFTPNPGRNLRPDLAAYWLDRHFGLDMVPVTVAREIDGEAGTLQYVPPLSITEEQRQAERLGADAWCPLGDQFAAMYVFDSLIANTGRTVDRLRYSTDNFQLLLLGHDVSFPTSGELPEHLRSVELVLSPAWIERLQALEEAELETALDGMLDRRRVRALLERRDAILASAGGRQAP